MKSIDDGAHFFKCDLEVHTPRDINWRGDRPITEEEREAYAREFVVACRQKGIQAVAITDHHDVTFLRYIKEAALNEMRSDGRAIPQLERLIVFPGMELTLGVPCQALIIFDANLPSELLDEVLVLLNIDASPADNPQTAPIARLDHIQSIDQLYEMLDRREFLRGKFTVLPNVTDRGHGTIMRREFAAKYKNIPCVGGYINGSILNKLGKGNERILSGGDAEWGNKKLALFQVSDSRSRDFGTLGAHTTWVKWATPTAEAIRQACLANSSRISQTEPRLPTIVITRLEVSNSKFMSRINLFFNPQYNALIGGRGTGKSTILEYLRWALCDQPPSAHDNGELPDFQKRRETLIDRTLVAFRATVGVHFLINDVAHIVRRKAESNEVSVKIGDADLQLCSEADVRSLLPVQAYSQKQLSSIGVKVDELRRFVQAPIKEELADISGAIVGVQHEFRDVHRRMATARSLQREIQRFTAEHGSTSKQAAELRKKVKGLSEGDKAAIERYGELESERQVVDDWERERERVSTLLENLGVETGEMPSRYDDLASLPNGRTLQDMEAQVEAAFQKLNEGLDTLAAAFDLDAPGEEYEAFAALRHKWTKSYEAGKSAYEKAKTRSATHEACR